MNRNQSKLVKLAEEASEVAKEALKAVHFPGREHNGRTPEQAVRDELIDLLICARILESLGVLEPIYESDLRRQFEEKRPRIVKYTEIAYALGSTNSRWVPEFKDIAR